MKTWLFNAPRRSLMLLVQGYRLFLSAWLGSSCRFTPSCSAYSLQALEQRGAMAGTYLTLHRLARCHPWCPGGHDPVPPPGEGLFTRHLAAHDAAGPPRCAGLPFSFSSSRFNFRKKTRP
jgi:putative membrane protein insertion efficiency factor